MATVIVTRTTSRKPTRRASGTSLIGWRKSAIIRRPIAASRSASRRSSRICARFGGAQQIGYMADSFGHPAQIPQILREGGLDSFVYTRGNGSELEEVGHEYRALMREQEERLEAQLQEQLEKQEEWFREKLERHERKVETENHAVSVHSHIEFTDQVKRQKQTEAELQRRMGEKDEEIGGMYAPDGRTFAPTPCRA